MTNTCSDAVLANDILWYLVYTKAKQESLAAEQLQNQGYPIFLPMLQKLAIRRGVRLQIAEPLFPRYIFIQPQAEQPLHSIRSTRGCVDLVRFGNRPEPITSKLIASIQSGLHKLQNSEVIRKISNVPRRGDTVKIQTGIFKDLQAIFLEPDGNKRALLLIELMGKTTKLTLDNSAFAKII